MANQLLRSFDDANIVRTANAATVTIHRVRDGKNIGGVTLVLSDEESAEKLSSRLQSLKARCGLGWNTPNMSEALEVYADSIKQHTVF